MPEITQVYDDMLMSGIETSDVITIVEMHMKRLDTRINIRDSCDHRTLQRYLERLKSVKSEDVTSVYRRMIEAGTPKEAVQDLIDGHIKDIRMMATPSLPDIQVLTDFKKTLEK